MRRPAGYDSATAERTLVRCLEELTDVGEDDTVRPAILLEALASNAERHGEREAAARIRADFADLTAAEFRGVLRRALGVVAREAA